MKIFKEVFQLGQHEIKLETGLIARQASGSVLVTMGKTVVLVTTVVKDKEKDGLDFFPLSVHYRSKFYSYGKIPGGFTRNEGRPSENEIIISRMIDRSLRPLFSPKTRNEIQIIATLLSFDPEIPPSIPALIGASASLSLSGIPMRSMVAGVSVGFKDSKYILNPSQNLERKNSSDLTMTVSGTKDTIIMVESESKSLPEDVMLGAILYGHRKLQKIIFAIRALKENFHRKKDQKMILEFSNESLKQKIRAKYFTLVRSYFMQPDKKKPVDYKTLKEKISDDATTFFSEENQIYPIVTSTIDEFKKEVLRDNIINGRSRSDGRSTEEIRSIDIKIGILPEAHGSALFTRGETQALVVTTLGNDRNAQLIEGLTEDIKDRYILQYNFLPFCVGEIGMMSSPKRREIGHGNLAKNATRYVFPDNCPYVVRVVSEITESNGSSSMATVCGSSLSMMNAGINLLEPVAGIAMGLIKEDRKFSILSDITGEEDSIGDMDLKVAGTKSGITALQMDIKSDGITREILSKALDQARLGRIHILNTMNKAISKPNDAVSHNAPQFHLLKIHPSKIRDLIGKNGSTIKRIISKTGASIEVDDSGDTKIFAKNQTSLLNAITEIGNLTSDLEVGSIHNGTITKIIEFGAFINLSHKKDGLLFFQDLEEYDINPKNLSEGDKLKVVISSIDKNGKIRLNLTR